MAFPELLKLDPPFVSQVWWLLRWCLVPLWFRQGFGTFFFFALRRGFFSGLRQSLLGQCFEGFQDIRVQSLQAVLLPALKMHDPRRPPSDIKLKPLGLQPLPKGLSIGAPAECLVDKHYDVTRLPSSVFCCLGSLLRCFAFPCFFNGSVLLELGHSLEDVPLKLHLNFPKAALGQTQAFGLSGRVRADNQVVVQRVLLVLMQVSEDQVFWTSLCDVALGNVAEGRLLPLEADALGPRDRDDFMVEVDSVLAPLKQVTILRELIPDSSEISGKQVVPDAPRASAGSSVNVPDKLAETGLLPAHGFNYHDPFSSSSPKQRLREVAARVMVAMYWVCSAAIS